jgi:hypothetical protein
VVAWLIIPHQVRFLLNIFCRAWRHHTMSHQRCLVRSAHIYKYWTHNNISTINSITHNKTTTTGLTGSLLPHFRSRLLLFSSPLALVLIPHSPLRCCVQQGKAIDREKWLDWLIKEDLRPLYTLFCRGYFWGDSPKETHLFRGVTNIVDPLPWGHSP